MITDYLPAPARKFIYSLFATAMAVEGVLDVAEVGPTGYGFLDEKAQGVVLGIAAVLGFGLAYSKANDVQTTQITIEDDPGDAGEMSVVDCIVAAAVALLVVILVIAISDNLTF